MARAGSLTAGGLGEAEEHFLLAAQGRVEPFFPLFIVRLEHLRQPRAAEGVVAGCVEAGPVLAHLDGDQRAGDDVDVRPPELRRNVEPEQAHFLGLGGQAGEIVRVQLVRVRVELVFQRPDFVAHVAAHLVDDHFLFFGEGEVHRGVSVV